MSEAQPVLTQTESKVTHIQINRPTKANALNHQAWNALGEAFRDAATDSETRAVVLSGAGNYFTAGIDFTLIAEIAGGTQGLPEGKKQEALYTKIRELQADFCAAESCSKPIVAAIHGCCYGGGIDLITACDIRYATKDTKFCVKEIDLAIVADVGTLQRLPGIVGQGIARELALTGRTFDGAEAVEMGLVNRAFDTQEEMLKYALQTAETIASKSPIAVRGTKKVLNYSRDHSVEEGLEYVATFNAGMLLSQDAQEAFAAMMEKREPNFED